MGRDFREVAKDITSALNLGEDEGKIDGQARHAGAPGALNGGLATPNRPKPSSQPPL